MKIAIAGYGVEGKANYAYFRDQGELTIVDEQPVIDDLPEGVLSILGEGSFSKLQDFDMVVRTAGLSPHKITTNGIVWSATNEFFIRCPVPIIGVTGTKGKGTTCSLIADMLRAAGKTVHLVGNIGVPALDVISVISPDDIVVFELSSFQLWDIQKSPHIAVVLMVEPDHLNIHKDFADYVAAKSNIGRYQQPQDIIIYHPTNISSASIAAGSPALIKQRYQTPEGAYVHEGSIIIGEQNICSVSEVALVGEYNLQNVCAAVTASWVYIQDATVIASAIHSFQGLEHRLEYVATKNGIQFYNDSYSSAPTATIAAVSAFSEPIVLIVGGLDRGIDLHPLADMIQETANIRKVIIIGAIKQRLAAILQEYGFDNFIVSDANDMDSIVDQARENAMKDDVVILSPGCASFDMFKNFAERGEKFKWTVKGIHE